MGLESYYQKGDNFFFLPMGLARLVYKCQKPVIGCVMNRTVCMADLAAFTFGMLPQAGLAKSAIHTVLFMDICVGWLLTLGI
jgi:hypothetical protein